MPENHAVKNNKKMAKKRRKRCHYCHKLVDETSRVSFRKKIYCSYTCLVKALVRSGFALVKFRLPETSALIRPLRSWLFWRNLALLVLLIAILFNVHHLTHEIRLLRLAQQAAVPAKPETSKEAERETMVRITEKPDAMVLQNRITISGEASKNVMISLMVNGDLRKVTLPEKNKFHFRDVVLNYGANEIVVQGTTPDGSSAVLERMTIVYGSPRISYLARSLNRGNVHIPSIALTFDGGAGNGVAEKILNYLTEKNVHCTMFLTGAFIKNFPELVKRMVRDGHEVANHTWSHPHLTTFATNGRHYTIPGMTRKVLQEELQKTAQAFQRLTGKKMAPYWRAPYGEHNMEIRQWAAEIGYRQVGWTLGNGNGETMDTLDWVADTTASTYKTSQEILDRILNFGSNSDYGANGGIILMHLDTQRSVDQPYQIIPALIDSMRQRGYEFVKISELIAE